MNICGIMVHVLPDSFDGVKAGLEKIRGVEVHGVSDEGRVVVTLEEDDENLMAESMFAIQNVAGVISASMIYHHREDETQANREESLP